MTTNRTWWRDFPWLAMLGALAMFLSWVFQHLLMAHETSERLRLDRSQLAIDLQQLRMEQWQILYLEEKAKPEPNREILLVAAFKSLQSHLNLVAWSSARIRDDDTKAKMDIDEKNQVKKNLVALYKAGDLEAIERDLRGVAAIESQVSLIDRWSEQFKEKFWKIQQRETNYSDLFLLMFVCGSFLAVWDFFRQLSKRNQATADQPGAAPDTVAKIRSRRVKARS